MRYAPRTLGILGILPVVIGGAHFAGCSSSSDKESPGGSSDGSAESVAMDGATDGGASSSSDAAGATVGDGGPAPPPSDGGGCPSATILCNGLCLAAGQTASGCTALVTGIDSRTIAVAGGYVYYDVSPDVWRVPTTGGTPASFVSAAQYIEALVADSTNLYLTAAGVGSPVIGYAPLAGGGFKKLDSSTRGTPQIGGIAVDATNVYWVEDPIYSGYSPAIYKVAIAGDAGAIAIGNAQDPVAVAVDSKDVYWADSQTAVVWATPVATAGTLSLDAGADAGGALELFSTYVNEVPMAFAVDPNYLYWGDGNTLSRWPKDGGATQVLANDYAAVIALDGTVVYTLTEFGQIVRFDTVAMSGDVLASVPGRSVGAIGIDATNVYVLLAPLGEAIAGIVRVAK